MATIQATHPPIDGQQLGRITYVEPVIPENILEVGYFGSAGSKSTTHAELPLQDLRPHVFTDKPTITLATHAFTALKHRTAMLAPPYNADSILDSELLETIYAPEIDELVRNLTGAVKTLVIRAAMRTKVEEKLEENDAKPPGKIQDGIQLDISKFDFSKPMYGFVKRGQVGPARTAHLDYSIAGMAAELRNARTDIAAEAADIIAAQDVAIASNKPYEGRRWAAYSVWRAWKPVTRDPIAMCDPNSIDYEKDMLDSWTKRPGTSGPYASAARNLSGGHATTQKWYWLPIQQPDEVVVIQFYDSDAEKYGRPIGAPHGSPELVGVENENWRESVEVRILAFW